MQGAPRRSARSFFVLPLVLALLAFVALPAFANAGEIPQYEVEKTESFKVPNTTTESVKPKHITEGNSGQSNNPAAKASEAGGGDGSQKKGEPEESGEKEKSQSGGAGAGEGGGNGGGSEGSQSGGNGGKTNDGIGGSEAVTGGGTGSPVAHKTESSSGGSSPVVPILIAVIVLAAISIGVVLYRQRKSGQGPDSRVSSPNAS
jgi:cobalamin biosynthesis Mg chelatase CobN